MAKIRKKKAPMGKVLSKESVVANWLIDLINSGKLVDEIVGKDEVESVIGAADQASHLPRFSIDKMSRLASARASKFVLGQLGLLEIVAVDKSISLVSGEVLRPDIIAYNPESRVVLIFEVKREKGPERQAVSEVAGYEHEIQNLFPFLSNMDICFVIVARDWSDLLDHGVASLTTWSGKQCLALSLDYDAEPRQLQCRIVEAWYPTATVDIPEEAMQCFDVVLYEKTDDSLNRDSEFPPPLVQTAISMIAREGDRMRSHGFLMLWRNLVDSNRAYWVFTLCTLDPGVFHATMQKNADGRQSTLTTYFAKVGGLSNGSMPGSGYRIIDHAKNLLSEDYDVQIENHNTWKEKQRQHRGRSEPFLFEFWGEPGDFSRSFVTSQTVRSSLLPFLSTSKLDWTHPLVALPAIGYMSGRIPFVEGQVFCRDLFEAGITLGSLQICLLHIRSLLDQRGNDRSGEKESALRIAVALSKWCFPDAVALMAELAQLFKSYSSIQVPPPPLSNREENSVESVGAIIEWVTNHLIDESGYHKVAFLLGLQLSGCYELLNAGKPLNETPDGFEEIRKKMILFCRNVTEEMIEWGQNKHISRGNGLYVRDYIQGLTSIANIEGEANIVSGLKDLDFDRLLDVLRLCVDAVDKIRFPVHHTLVPTGPLKPDMSLLKSRVQHIFEKGDKRAAVIVSASGAYGVGHLPEECKVLPPLESTEDAIYFLDQRIGFALATKLSWEEVGVRFAKGL
ncbi:hypothetical protein [Xanthomonas euvesicatoria]|uniref:hypothetical protein n=1 Tax=Xanthomonas euvesicatoria TaxID=456327 RepID=UPI000A80934A|nr:hypothetical protein [Xanthomonas euvesicatoria]MCC8613097.1 hypothetical protein [Xanthomonas euvesicatoria pv. euvesicatoria]